MTILKTNPGGEYAVEGMKHLYNVGKNNDGKIYYSNPNSKAGFNFGYFLYIPTDIKNGVPLVVRGNNSCNTYRKLEEAIDNCYEQHKKDTDDYMSMIVRPEFVNLEVPLLMPVFPRIEPNSKTEIYIQQLSENTMEIGQPGFESLGTSKDDLKKLERVDLQLIAMINDAKSKLKKESVILDDKIIMYGFSTDGLFAARFAFLHPEIVKAVCAGGVGGCMPLPLKEYQGLELPYPIGASNYKEITGKEFDEEAYKKINQFYFINDKEDDKPVRNGYKRDFNIIFIRLIYSLTHCNIMRKVLGDTIAQRWENLIKIYKEIGYNEVANNCRTYPGIHDLRPAYKDIFKFISDNIQRDKGNDTEREKDKFQLIKDTNNIAFRSKSRVPDNPREI